MFFKNTIKNEKTEKYNSKKGLLIGIFLICLFFIGVMIAVNIYILNIANNNPATIQAIYSATFFTDGLTLIGLAISVWAGLNIANAIERRELDKNKRDVDKLKKRTNKITKDISPIQKNIENISNTLWFLFENELLKTRDDEASLYLYSIFTKKANNKSSVLISTLPDLIVIEQLFNQVYSLHDSKQELNEEINQRGKKGLETIEECFGRIQDKGDKDIINYLKYRKAELCFYLGYSTKDLGYVYDYYKTAGDLYIELHESFKAFLPEYNDDFLIRDNINKYIPVFGKNNENDLKLSIYFANSICEAYSRILLCVDEKSFKNEEVQYTKDGREIKDLEEITKKAIFYGCCSTKWANDIVNNEVYYRNLGCAYERYERLFGKLGDYHKEIIKNYQKAFELIVDNKVLSYRIQSVYKTLLSYLRKYFDEKLKFSEIFLDSKDEGQLEAFRRAIFNNDKLSEDNANYLKIFYQVSNFARYDNHRFRLQYSTNGLALSIIAYYKLKQDVMVEQICELSVQECIDIMEENINIIQLMKVKDNDNFYKWLFKRYKTIKTYYKGKE